MKRLLLSLLFLFLFTQSALAAKPAELFDSQEIKPLPRSFEGWHKQFEKNNSYGESWFTIVQLDDGGVLFAMLSITNLGLKTFDGIFDMHFYAKDGKKHYFHKEFHRDKVKASTKTMDVTIDKARMWRDKSGYHLSLDYEDYDIKLDIIRRLGGMRFGSGKVSFFKDKSAVWTIGLSVPYGRSTGSLKVKGKSYDLKGAAYFDHGYATIKMPDFVRLWRSIRAYKGDFALVLHDQFFTKRFGEKRNQFGFLCLDGKTPLPLSDIELKPTAYRKHEKSKKKTPTAYTFKAKAKGGYQIEGTLKEKRFLDGIDVLGQVSWAVRVLIKAFYASPYLFRNQSIYDLTITHPDGKTEKRTGTTVIESNPF